MIHPPWPAAEFEARLRALEARYHIHHPFNRRLNAGELQPFQVRGWVANRFCYQLCIPVKDAAILANCADREVRRRWIERILDHDGRGDLSRRRADPSRLTPPRGAASEASVGVDSEGDNAGGIEAWTRLGLAVGLTREALWSQQHVQPGVRFAVDAYVNFARRAPWQEAAISSLTELFAPKIHADRLATWPSHYAWIEPEGLAYFRSRIRLANRDVEHGLEIAQAWCSSRERQERALEIVRFKLDILWAMLDAIERAYPDDLAPQDRP